MSVNVMRIKATSHLVTLNHFDPDLGILKRQQALVNFKREAGRVVRLAEQVQSAPQKVTASNHRPNLTPVQLRLAVARGPYGWRV
jgi:hypothetical protein